MNTKPLTKDHIHLVEDYSLQELGQVHPAVACKVLGLKDVRAAVQGLLEELKKRNRGIQRIINKIKNEAEIEVFTCVKHANKTSIEEINHWLGAVLDKDMKR